MSLWSVVGSVASAFTGNPIFAAVGGAIDQNKAAKDARNQSQAATDAAIGEQRRQFDLMREDSQPFRTAGVNALTRLTSEMDRPVTSADVMSDPGYQFGLDQGQQAIDRKIAAMGGRVSGAAIKAAGRFGVGAATAGYGAAYQRRQDQLNRLQAMAGMAQTSTQASAVAGQNTANQISGLITNQGDMNAASTLARGNIWGNAGNQLAAMYGRQRQQNPYVDGGNAYDAYDYQG